MLKSVGISAAIWRSNCGIVFLTRRKTSCLNLFKGNGTDVRETQIIHFIERVSYFVKIHLNINKTNNHRVTNTTIGIKCWCVNEGAVEQGHVTTVTSPLHLFRVFVFRRDGDRDSSKFSLGVSFVLYCFNHNEPTIWEFEAKGPPTEPYGLHRRRKYNFKLLLNAVLG